VPETGFAAFLGASVLVGIGLGVVVSGALRTIGRERVNVSFSVVPNQTV